MAGDKPAGAGTAHAPAQPGKWRLGMPGVVTVVWALLPTLKVNEALLPLPLEAVLLLSGLQTAVLLALAVGLLYQAAAYGSYAADKKIQYLIFRQEERIMDDIQRFAQ